MFPAFSACLPDDVIMAMAEPDAVSDHLRRSALRSFARACSGCCGSPLVPLISLPPPRSSRLFAPLDRVGERGAWASGVLLPAVLVSFSDWLWLLLASDGGDECVDFVDCLLSVDCAGMIGYILNRALSMVRRLISLVFSAVA